MVLMSWVDVAHLVAAAWSGSHRAHPPHDAGSSSDDIKLLEVQRRTSESVKSVSHENGASAV